jgi:hypothetical protein
VRDAVFTEPDDQSPWFYHRWVVDQISRLVHSAAAALSPRDGNKDQCHRAALRPGADSEGSAQRVSEGVIALRSLLEDIAALKELSAAEPACKCAWRLRCVPQ